MVFVFKKQNYIFLPKSLLLKHFRTPWEMLRGCFYSLTVGTLIFRPRLSVAELSFWALCLLSLQKDLYSVPNNDWVIFLPHRSARPLRSAAPMSVEPRAVWPLGTWTSRGKRGLWGCPKRQPVTASCASSKAQSVTSGMGSPSASARTGVRRSRASPVPPTGSPTTTSATWMQRPASKALH